MHVFLFRIDILNGASMGAVVSSGFTPLLSKVSIVIAMATLMHKCSHRNPALNDNE